MTVFTEESILIAKNWETVEDIIKAAEQLRSDLEKFLLSIRSELTTLEWWEDGWEFGQEGSEVYISNERWADRDGDYEIWIGVEGFLPSHIFGQDPPPKLYVWLSKKRDDLVKRLGDEIGQIDGDNLGELDTRSNRYVVTGRAKKCLPDEIEIYPDAVRRQIIDFMTHYANVLLKLDPVIQEYLKP